jgi:NTP pyrophosphatase (non-canonical NTP hydrolase)
MGIMNRDHFNQLSPAEAERLAFLIEECGEVIQAASKVLRHGYESFDPTIPIHERLTNRGALARELGDVGGCDREYLPQ